MNCETCQLKELELDPTEIRDVLRWLFIPTHISSFLEEKGLCISEKGVVHTIFFHRALGLVRPKDVDCELFEITYVQCGDAELEKKIDEKLEQFVAWSEKHPNRKSQVCLSFYEVKSKQSSWFGSKVERHYWEQWIVNVNVHPINPPRSSFLNTREKVLEETSTRRSALETSVREILFQIIKFANEKQEHIPPITNTEVVSFPYEISTPSSSELQFGWNKDAIKRILQSGHPYSLS